VPGRIVCGAPDPGRADPSHFGTGADSLSALRVEFRVRGGAAKEAGRTRRISCGPGAVEARKRRAVRDVAV